MTEKNYYNIGGLQFTKLQTDLICKALGQYKSGRIPELPSDVKQVVFNNKNTVVILNNGKKGVAKCSNEDTFDPYVGFVLAYHKAKHSKNFALANILTSCLTSAQKKGYAQAILKNY